MNPSTPPLTRRDGYDVVVLGGGIAGAAAAWTLARSGASVLVVEPTSTLGREVARSRLVRWDVTREETSFGRSLLTRLDAFGGRSSQGVDPFALAHVLDVVLAEAGAEVLFHVWPTGTRPDAAGHELEVASRQGRDRIRADLLVDASRRGRLAAELFGTRPEVVGPTRVSLLLTEPLGPTVDDGGRVRLELPGLGPVDVRWHPGPWPDQVSVQVCCPVVLRPGEEHELVGLVVERLRDEAGPLPGSTFLSLADEMLHGVRAPSPSLERQRGSALYTAWPAGTPPVDQDQTYLGALARAGEVCAQHVLVHGPRPAVTTGGVAPPTRG